MNMTAFRDLLALLGVKASYLHGGTLEIILACLDYNSQRGPGGYSLVTVLPPNTTPHYDSHGLPSIRFSSLKPNASAPALYPVDDLKAQHTPPTPTRLSCRVELRRRWVRNSVIAGDSFDAFQQRNRIASCRRCEHTRRQS